MPTKSHDTGSAIIEMRLPRTLYDRLRKVDAIGMGEEGIHNRVSIGLQNALILTAEAHAQIREES